VTLLVVASWLQRRDCRAIRLRASAWAAFDRRNIDGYQGSDTSVAQLFPLARSGLKVFAAPNPKSEGHAMRLDSDIKRDVEDELRSDPDIDATDIAIAAKGGVVTLTGFVRSFRQKRKAEQDVKRVAGVVGLANNIEVRLPIIHRRPDPEIARDAVEEIKKDLPFSLEKIRVIVRDALVTLEGEVEWHYQREDAEEAVWRVRGVKDVVNNIQLQPLVLPTDIKRKIEEALRRAAELDASRISVEADGSEVILRGTVRTWAEREEAEHVAWRAPGVSKVDNRLGIDV
jgi:osmotically-inducible protein OsmY